MYGTESSSDKGIKAVKKTAPDTDVEDISYENHSFSTWPGVIPIAV